MSKFLKVKDTPEAVSLINKGHVNVYFDLGTDVVNVSLAVELLREKVEVDEVLYLYFSPINGRVTVVFFHNRRVGRADVNTITGEVKNIDINPPLY